MTSDSTQEAGKVYLRDFNLQGGEPCYLEIGESVTDITTSDDGTAVLMIRDARGTTAPLDVEIIDHASPLPAPPADLVDAWERFQSGGGAGVTTAELRAIDEWRADCAEEAGY